MNKRISTCTWVAIAMLVGAAPASAMKIEIDKGNYACAGDSVGIEVTDNTVPLPASIIVSVETFDGGGSPIDHETVTSFVQIPDPVDQIFEASPLPLTYSGTPSDEDGLLNAATGGTVRATYVSGGVHRATGSTCAVSTPSISGFGMVALAFLLASTSLVLRHRYAEVFIARS